MRGIPSGPIRTEVAVLGGGPAGAALACRLASLGHEVCLVDRAAVPGRRTAETLPLSVLSILDPLGLRPAAEASAYRRNAGAHVLWQRPDDPASLVNKASLSISRRRFDRALRDGARTAGAQVLASCRPGTPRRTADPGWCLPVELAGEWRTIEARFLVDARGKRARIEGRSPPMSARTLALSAISCRLPACGPETCIEACPQAWCWGMALPDGRYTITIFVDADACRAAAENLESICRRTLRGSRLLSRCLTGLESPITVCDATPSLHVRPIGLDFLRVGEAAFAVDPLSSQGVQLAITSAVQGAAALHTMLVAPAELDAALVFYRERQQQAAERSRSTAGRLYAAQDRHPPGTFWQRRARTTSDPPLAPPKRPLTVDPNGLVRLSAEAAITETPVLAGDLIRRAPALSHPALNRPIAYLGDTALAPLLAPMADGIEVDRLLHWWERSVPPRTAREILLWLAARGIVVPVGRPAPAAQSCSLTPARPP